MARCLHRLLAAAAASSEQRPAEEVIGRLLEILVDLEPAAAAGVRVSLGRGEEVIQRRSARDDRDSGVPPRHTTEPPLMGRMFPDLALELHASLPGTHSGYLSFAAPRFSAEAPAGYQRVLEDAAAVMALVLRGVSGAPTGAEAPGGLAQLEKLASIGQTASQIVHELNNPLTAIIAYSDYLMRRLRDQDMDDGDVDRVVKINEAAVRIQRFCRELTDYSRPAGSLRSPVDVREILDSALSFCVHGLRSADITVERVYGEVPSIQGIDTALTQVFVNLITNAWHAMPGGGTLSLRARSHERSVVVEVADEGHGVTAEDRDRIFDAYYTTKGKGDGVGLGLSIVKQIVGDHGGDIRCEPRDTGGTIFVITFPITRA